MPLLKSIEIIVREKEKMPVPLLLINLHGILLKALKYTTFRCSYSYTHKGLRLKRIRFVDNKVHNKLSSSNRIPVVDENSFTKRRKCCDVNFEYSFIQQKITSLHKKIYEITKNRLHQCYVL